MAVAPQQQWQRDMGKAMAGEVQEHCVPPPLLRPLKRTYDMFVADYCKPIPLDEESHRVKKAVKLDTHYRPVLHQPTLQWNLREKGGPSTLWDPQGHKGWAAEYLVTDTQPCLSFPGVPWTAYSTVWRMPSESAVQFSAVAPPASQEMDATWTAAGVGDIYWHPGISEHLQPAGMSVPMGEAGGYTNSAFMLKEAPTMPKPQWHPPWQLHRVISGHEGWVRCVAVEPGNQWFATGSSDKAIKIWDLASGKLKLSMTEHVGVVRGVTVSTRSPHLFSCGGCGQVMCWDLEYNKVIRHYCGHQSVVYGLDLHPTIDVLVTCSSDSTVRVWDPRTKGSVHTLLGHTDGVAAVKCQAAEIFTGSHDTTVRIWNLVTGKPRVTLTNHRGSARAIVLHPRYYTFASGAPGDIKQWKIPDGDFIQSLSGHKAVINTLAVNSDDVLVSGAGDGSVCFWDWTTGHIFQRVHAAAKPDSSHSDSRIFACAFDQSGRTLLTAGTEKTIKVYKADDIATEENHPLS